QNVHPQCAQGTPASPTPTRGLVTKQIAYERGVGNTPYCPRVARAPSVPAMETTLGRFGRLGLWTADHRRAVALAWLTVIVGLGGLAPFAEHALSGAGWMAVGSQSDREAKLVDRYFPGRGSYALLAVVPADAGLRSV